MQPPIKLQSIMMPPPPPYFNTYLLMPGMFTEEMNSRQVQFLHTLSTLVSLEDYWLCL